MVKELENYKILIFLLILLGISILIIYLLAKAKKRCEEEVVQKVKEIEEKLSVDKLTGLKNRVALDNDIKNAEFVSIVLLDLDSFGDINELYGFVSAELVLVEVAKILKEFEKNYNVSAYRLSGDIFCLLDKDNMPFFQFELFIEDLILTFKNKLVHIDKLGIDVLISMTLGISIVQEEPVRTAAIALKKAKKSNQRFLVYNNEIDTKEVVKKSIYWREKIQKAILENNVIPFYQPIFDRNKEIVKYETLMRIRDIDENEKVIYFTPNLFLSVSFKTKQYLQLSHIIISKTFDNLLKTKKQISLNISFKDILNNEFIEFLDNKMDRLEKKDKQRIIFEILESDYISDYEHLEEFISKYKKHGVKIAIDDFGTGYSNFIRIMRIRPDYLKIDSSLIKYIDIDKNSYEIVKSIIAFSKALNIKTIAEYVHTKEILDLLLEMGVDEFQGFYLGEPSLNIE
ncbi:GGDEF domain-containing phosphodiesterase [Aliarcobacter butzleri]|uniref:EAL domain-containing protein n=1 Tax=Aliarcobacter butzleri TaxID=28197 RepID=UPI00263EEAB1|nr:GGDEF domain-containing phosphodiesterase [Aliarcobacter butzleri]MDN5121732.1 GGDEF domain-containing phosphodiesterase [Aliarcobacter butzleri]